MAKKKQTVEQIMAETIDKLRDMGKNEDTVYDLQLTVKKKETRTVEVDKITYAYTVR